MMLTCYTANQVIELKKKGKIVIIRVMQLSIIF